MIYFDGYLPPTKLAVRMERLRVQTKRLSDYYNPNQTRSKSPAGQGTISNSKSSGPNIATAFPPPFLVPAVMDALNVIDRYKTITTVVPGEADLYCARYLEQHGGIVLTGDSDLLVHGLGPKGAVCFFADINATPEINTGSLRSHIFRPPVIADRLALPKPHGLHSLAFEILMDTQGTFRKLLAQAVSLNSINEDECKYEEFCQEYAVPKSNTRKAEVSDGSESIEFLQALQKLDPRISEFVIQFPSIASLAGQDILDSASRHVFLPFLLDCPVRTNAWEISTPVRQLAYGLVNSIVPQSERRSTMFEHRRQQKNSGGREWQLPSMSEIPDACSDLVAQFDKLSAKLFDLSCVDIWTVWAIYQDVGYSSSHGKPDLSVLATGQLFDTRNKSSMVQNYTWDIIQFYAHVEGSYYSFRILKQIIGLLITHSQRKQLPASIFLLHDCLKTLPPLNVRRGLSESYSGGQLLELKRVLQAVRGILGVEERKPSENPPAAIQSPRKKRKKNLEQEATTKRQVTNPFELLEVE
jgi:hypothetical protein